jgi:hypothetical protein
MRMPSERRQPEERGDGNEEGELKLNTDVTKAIHALTKEIHRQVVPAAPPAVGQLTPANRRLPPETPPLVKPR